MRIPNVFLLVMALVVALGCTSTGSTRNEKFADRPNNTVTDENDVARDLAYYLRQVPGVIVNGNGNNATVKIRGAVSINAGTNPLYVIDGQAVGTDYAQVNGMINVKDIDYVRVLKGTDAALYGVRGGNGVIEIITKKS